MKGNHYSIFSNKQVKPYLKKKVGSQGNNQYTVGGKLYIADLLTGITIITVHKS